MVNNDDILVQGNKIVDVNSVIRSSKPEIIPLKEALLNQAKRIIVKKTPDGKPINRDVTIMGDKEIPYKLLKKIMYTCTLASYGNISLAVMRKSEKSG